MDVALVGGRCRRRGDRRGDPRVRMGVAVPMEPLELLHEERGPRPLELPAGLERLYGGGLALDEEVVFANFVSTLDGIVAIPSLTGSNKLISAGSEGDRFVMGLLRAVADVVLIGAGTLHGSPSGSWTPGRAFPPAAGAFGELRRRLRLPEAPELAILSGSGSISPDHPALASGALVLTSEPAAAALRRRLPAGCTIVTLGDDARLDPRGVVESLRRRGHRRILVEAGPHGFGALVAAGVVDELFLTVSPLLAGRAQHSSRLGLVESADLMPPGVETRLLSLRRQGAHLFLRYGL
jgi:riboflavin biosynthesis pyrimidine reductase